MKLQSTSRISEILNAHPNAQAVLESVSPRFGTLRNPVLRKLMAPRTTLAMAAKVGGCSLHSMIEALLPLGFEVEDRIIVDTVSEEPPAFMEKLKLGDPVELDVRPYLAQGQDPFTIVLKHLNKLPDGSIFKLINGFEPAPLIEILSRKGYASFVTHESSDCVFTYFHKVQSTPLIPEMSSSPTAEWETVIEKWISNISYLDVRLLEMPGPMMAILEALNDLPSDRALMVYHKKIPLFLIPELEERGFEYRMRTVQEGQVELLIFHKP